MKSYTDIEQSRKLAEILPMDSADQTWQRVVIAGANLGVPEEKQYRHNGDMPFQIYSGIGIPCWSLEALLDVLPFPSLHSTSMGWRCDSYNEEGTSCIFGEPSNNPIDACMEMILKLYKLNLL